MFKKLLAVALILPALFVSNVYAEDPYPNRPITLIVPNPPGGSSDANARILADALTKILKQPVVVNFKPGVGGQIGNAFVANAKPDGYTLLMGLSSIMVSPDAERAQGKPSLYEVNQLTPIAMISNDPMVMLVKTDAPWKNLNDLMKAAKEKPNALTYSSSGNFGPIHLSVEMLAHAAGAKFLQVPFGGGGPSMLALLGGQVDMTTAIPSVAIPQIESGKVRPIAVSGPKRIKLLPNVPSYRESGFDAEYNIWNGLFVPTGTPPAVIDTLNKAIKEAVQSGQIETAMNQRGMIFDYRDTNDFKKFAQEDGDRMVKVIKAMPKQ
ncbi:Bug family tripartite tricarboxylate transporter substrate binding protein [Polynucleobacter sinensis]|jgi:tripartite-type tricarboxylate transporter receptor subunit TctC|uniref:Bug family tripartite tricarboxylate transporter substrate binding protein n=1 Tax=Polynucleobacter sinensis TaxID=1743157 RepID=UPI000781A276|nr:tripartite tricarboxylate transporter substrate binding protein [Polynucleobacter sinensis]